MNLQSGMIVNVASQLHTGPVVVTGERTSQSPTADFVGGTEYGEYFLFGIHNIVAD